MDADGATPSGGTRDHVRERHGADLDLLCPSRASFLTGLYAHSTGVWSNGRTGSAPTGGWQKFHDSGMEDRTLAVWLDAAGYRTVLVGKYMNHYDDASSGYVPPGWDGWHAFREENGKYYDYDLMDQSGNVKHFGSKPRDYSTDVLGRYAVSAIRATPDERPLFLLFAPYAIHGVVVPAPRHAELGNDLPRYRPPNFNERAIGDKPSWLRRLSPVDPARVESVRARQFRALQAVDEAVGRILDALRAEGRLHDTLIIFTSDNGASWGEHRIAVSDKFLPYEAQTRVPLIVRWDSHVPAHARNRRLVGNLDLPVTIAEAASVPTDHVDGQSFFSSRRRGLLLESPTVYGGDGNGLGFTRPAYCAWRTRSLLYVRYANGREELYDYRKDPWELQDRSAFRVARDTVRALRAKVRDGCTPEPPGFHW